MANLPSSFMVVSFSCTDFQRKEIESCKPLRDQNVLLKPWLKVKVLMSD